MNRYQLTIQQTGRGARDLYEEYSDRASAERRAETLRQEPWCRDVLVFDRWPRREPAPAAETLLALAVEAGFDLDACTVGPTSVNLPRSSIEALAVFERLAEHRGIPLIGAAGGDSFHEWRFACAPAGPEAACA